MKTVYKYNFEIADEVCIEMPLGADILCVQVQNDTPCIWALVDTEQPVQKRWFSVYGTGHPAPNAYLREYVGTIQMMGGRLVWHVFHGAGDNG